MADKETATTVKVASPVISVVAAPKSKVANAVTSTVVAPKTVKTVAPVVVTVAAVTTRVAPGGDTVQPAAIGKAKYN